MCLKQANAGADCTGVYPPVLSMSAYWHHNTDFPTTAHANNATSLASVVHHGYSRHLYAIRAKKLLQFT